MEDKEKIRLQVRKILVATHGPGLSAAVKGLKESQEIRMKFNIPVPEDIGRIKNLLKQKGHKLFVVGGAVRDEFIKGIKSAKSVKHFLEMLNRYGLFSWIFPGLNVDIQYINRMQSDYHYDDYIVLIAHLLSNNNIDVLRKKLNELKYSVDEVKAITFLISLLNLNSDTAIALKRAQKNSGVTNDQIRNFGANSGIMSQLLDAFEDFEFTVKSQELIDQGFSGKALGAEIERREKENFEKLLKGV